MYKVYFIKYLVILLTIFPLQSTACEVISAHDSPVLIFPPKFDSTTPEKDYVFQLIQLVLKKSSDKFGPCEAILLNKKLPLKRLELYLEKNKQLHVASLTVSRERDQRFRVIPIPISKGLMGYRLLMIPKGKQSKFSNVNSVSDLSKYVAGQGTGWADVNILKHNGLPVLTTGSIKTLIDMLVYERFDYFPRGALQITTEIQAYQDKAIEVDSSLLLTYPSMTALYVNSLNAPLAQRLEYGLRQAFNDGSFDTFFNSHPSSVQALKNLNLQTRKIIHICNPILPSWVPLDKNEYWLEPWPEKILNRKCGIEESI